MPTPTQSKNSGNAKARVIDARENCLRITKSVIEDFSDWLRKDNPSLKESTYRQYMYYVPRLEGLVLCGKEDVSKAFEKMGGLNKTSYEAFSRFLTFIDKTMEHDELVSKLRKAMPRKPKAKTDTWVPSDDLILEAREKIREYGPPYTLFYNILVSSGCRGTEARYIINNIMNIRYVKLDGYVRLHLPPELQRGSKNEFVIYLPLEVYNQILEYKERLPNQDNIEKTMNRAGIAIKYYRKWWRQKLKEKKIDSENIEAFQGRVSSVGGRHYTDWIPLLDESYRIVLPLIKKFIIR